MDGELPRQELLETNIMILRRWIDPAELPDEMAISAITLATGRKPRRRIADLMIAATAIAEDLPLLPPIPATTPAWTSWFGSYLSRGRRY